MPKTTFNKETLIWSGKPAAPIPVKNLGQALLNVLNQPERVVQISDNNDLQITNREIYQKSILVAKNLTKSGFVKPNVIGIYSRNNHYLAPIIFGCIINGIPVNPIDPAFKKDEIVHMFRMTKPSAIFCERENVAELKEALIELNVNVPIYVFHHKIYGCLLAEDLFEGVFDDIDFKAPDIGEPDKEICVIICSSGTTGLSKGVSISYFALQANGIPIVSPNAINFAFSSLYWLSGFGSLVTGTLGGGVRVITTESFSPELALKIIEKYKIETIFTPPSNLAMILEHPDLKKTDLSTIKQFWCGGSIVHKDLIIKMNQWLPNGQVFVGYGMTESSVATSSISDPVLGSVGQVADDIQMKIIDDDGNKCGIGIDGEIYLYTKYPFLGYYGNEELTKTMFDSDGFIKSGDIGHFDENGHLYVVDRIKDILKYRNSQISPSELESVIQKHDGVKLACVCGIPDFICTDLPAAAIVKTDDSNVTEDEIQQLIKESFSDAKQLRGGVYFLDSFPMTPSGKIQKRKVKEIVVELYRRAHPVPQE